MSIILDNAPQYLRQHGLFCLWRYEDRDGKKTKVPYDPHRPQDRGDSTDRNKFVSFDQIREVWRQTQTGFSGVGAGVFDGLSAVDIDHCIDSDGKLSELASDIIGTLDSYTEVSPSGEGIRIFFRGGKPYDRERYYINNRTAGLEVYICGMTNKFLTFTGNVINHKDVEARGEQISAILDKYMRRSIRKNHNDTVITPIETDLSDAELIDKAADAANGDRFRALWSGNTSGYNSQSEADQALCNLLAFWTGRDADRMDRLFRQSGLMRPKWNRRQSGSTYGKITIQNAISSCGEVYTPKRQDTPFSRIQTGSNIPQDVPQVTETLEPSDYSDLGQSVVFSKKYGDRIRFSRATGFLVYDGKVWSESDLDAQRLAQELTTRQLDEARKRLRDAQDALIAAQEADDDAQTKAAKATVTKAKSYHSFVLKRRGSFAIAATLREAAPTLQVTVESLDQDPFLLNTPGGTVDLRTGELRPHRAEDFCTKITGCSPSSENAELWEQFLEEITCGDKDLQSYLQLCAGMIAIGAVKTEKLLIAWGQGGNGKSTLFNLWGKVLGTYSGSLPSESLIVRRNQNRDFAIAELRGKRFIVAAELSEGARLSTDAVKKLCSTDSIAAEKKHKDPFSFTPSHSIVLYTNILPEVRSTDKGTWDRLCIIPFSARFRNAETEIKDYAGYLFDHAGGAVLHWIIDGAVRFIASGYKLPEPDAVREAINKYRDDSDWLQLFLLDQCEKRADYTVSASTLYARYTDYCGEVGEVRRSQKDFKNAMEQAGFKQKRNSQGLVYCGLHLAEWQSTERTKTPFDYTA